MERDNFDELFYSFGIAIAACAIIVPMTKCFTIYYVYIIVAVLGAIATGLILYQRYIYKIFRYKERAEEESELRNFIHSLDMEHLVNESSRRWVPGSFSSCSNTSVPIRKFSRAVRTKRTSSYRNWKFDGLLILRNMKDTSLIKEKHLNNILHIFWYPTHLWGNLKP